LSVILALAKAMRRREFMKLLGGLSAMVPLAARAQQPPVTTIGFLHSAGGGYFAPYAAAFRQGLKETGYSEGQNLAIEYRWAEGHYERLPALVADLVNHHPAVIVAAGGTDPAKAVKAATTSIPIVFVTAADPVQLGLVAALNRPGGNATGVSLLATELSGKKFEMLRELVPQASLFGALINPSYPGAKSQSDEFQAAASQLGVRVTVFFAGTLSDIDATFATLKQQRIDALVLGNDPFFGAQHDQFVALAARYAIPVMYWQREYVTAGGLIAYGPQFADGYRQAGSYVGRILNGEKPADLPIVQPTKFDLVINLKTAKALGLTVPLIMQMTADEVIE
jgi:putative tryptophan/tyrosine transport system substrate-binding protein